MPGRLIHTLVAFTLLAFPVAASQLAEYRWKSRILWIPEPTCELLAKLKQYSTGLEERDVMIVRGKVGCEELVDEIRRTFFAAGETDHILLIGKDGRTHIKWQVGAFDIDEMFQRIDSMPMRIREVRSR